MQKKFSNKEKRRLLQTITNLNNNALYIHASVLDSVTPTDHFVCDNNLPSLDVGNRFSNPQANLNPPESGTLGPPGVFRLGGFFF